MSLLALRVRLLSRRIHIIYIILLLEKLRRSEIFKSILEQLRKMFRVTTIATEIR